MRTSARSDVANTGESSTSSSSLSRPVSSSKRPRLLSGSVIHPHPYRPHVLAQDRLVHWKTSYGLTSDNILQNLFPDQTISRWKEVMMSSVVPDTQKNYGAGLLRFTQFCDSYNISEVLRMPANEVLLSLFVAEMGAGKVRAGTISSWLSGIAMWHDINGAKWLGGRILDRTKSGAAALQPLPSSLSTRSPVTYKHMHILRAALDLSQPFDSAVWCGACLAWRGCTRLGEVLCKTHLSYDPKYNASRGCPKKRGLSSNSHHWLSLFIPFSKVKKILGEWLTFTSSNDEFDVIFAYDNHFSVNKNVPDDAPLLAFEGPNGWQPLTRVDFMNRCNSIWTAGGMESLLGHGFRIGGTTELLLAGTDPWIVMKQGRWSSKAFLLYWRSVEEILPLFIGNSLDRIDSLRKTVISSVSNT
ncbi:DNA breaking-rejoining enzyme [Mycena floridula]|nr:DNA breaking-rejoining enzyme [Mycena floridula]